MKTLKQLVATSTAAVLMAAPGFAIPQESPNRAGPTTFRGATEKVDANTFDVHLGDKDGPNCRVTLGEGAIDICGTSVPINASTQYRHTNRTPLGSCNAFGWCIKVQHRFAFSWRPEGERRQQIVVFLRNNKRAEQFNEAVAEWLDVMPEDMCERPNPIPGCR